jgi:hypothetical protein
MTSSSEPDTTPVPERADAVETPSPTPEPAPAPEPAPRRTGRAALALAVAALVVGGAALALPLLTAPPAPALSRVEGEELARRLTQVEAAKPATDEALGNRVGGLEKAVAGLSERVDRPAAADPRLDDLDRRLKAAEDAAAALRAEVAQAKGVAGETQRIGERLEALDRAIQDLRAGDAAAESLVLAAGQLRAAVSGDRPFEPEYQAARALAGDDPALTQVLDAIAPHAAKGVPTRSQLAERFAAEAGAIVRAGQGSGAAGWLDQVESAVASLVTVRRQGGDVVGGGTDAVVSRAEAALKGGDLAQAVKQIGILDGPAAAAASGWLAEAKARLAVEDAARVLAERAVAKLSAPAESAP